MQVVDLSDDSLEGLYQAYLDPRRRLDTVDFILNRFDVLRILDLIDYVVELESSREKDAESYELCLNLCLDLLLEAHVRLKPPKMNEA